MHIFKELIYMEFCFPIFCNLIWPTYNMFSSLWSYYYYVSANACTNVCACAKMPFIVTGLWQYINLFRERIVDSVHLAYIKSCVFSILDLLKPFFFLHRFHSFSFSLLSPAFHCVFTRKIWKERRKGRGKERKGSNCGGIKKEIFFFRNVIIFNPF